MKWQRVVQVMYLGLNITTPYYTESFYKVKCIFLDWLKLALRKKIFDYLRFFLNSQPLTKLLQPSNDQGLLLVTPDRNTNVPVLQRGQYIF